MKCGGGEGGGKGRLIPWRGNPFEWCPLWPHRDVTAPAPVFATECGVNGAIEPVVDVATFNDGIEW